METGEVRKRVLRAITEARERGRGRRELTAEAERAYAAFLQNVATPVAQQVASALKAEKRFFTVHTPSGGLCLAAERGPDDFIEFELDTNVERAQVVGHVRHTRGSRTLDGTLPIKPGVPPAELTEDDVLEFLLQALEPWLER